MLTSQTASPLRPSSEATVTRRGAAGALHVLVVEDDLSVQQVCAEMAGSHGCEVTTASSVPAASAFLHQRVVDLVFLDLRLPGGNGTALFDEIRAHQPRALVVVMTAYATVSTAVDLMRNGAFDFLQKPFGLDQISVILNRAEVKRKWTEPSRALQDRLAAGLGAGQLIGSSGAMEKVFRIISKVALTRHPVLLQGESGTGKELVARTIHGSGPDPATPFVTVDCSPLAPDELARELFGGREPDRPSLRREGVLVSAGQGTVYLNEIGDLSAPLQRRLLRALEERRLTALDSDQPIAFESRIVASSSRDLQHLVETGQFRRDLFYKLCVVNLRLPPLRERTEDIALLANTFLQRQSMIYGQPFVFSEDALRWITDYTWSGNVGELESVVERVAALATGSVVTFADLSTQIQAYAHAVQQSALEKLPSVEPVQEIATMQQLEKAAIQRSLREFHGDKLQAAKALGIGRTTLYRKLKEYGLGDEAA